MARDPMSYFGKLMLGCISDEYVRPDKGVVLEGVLFLALGVCASVATTYLLSLAGILL
ncbi:MAG: hypothetical protein ABSB56_09370 [Nitrososphaerales archaeon]|jgi:hypothetical protein